MDFTTTPEDDAKFVQDNPSPAVNESVGEPTPAPASPASETETTQVKEVQAGPEPKAEGQPTAEPNAAEPTPEVRESPRMQRRIRELSAKVRDAYTQPQGDMESQYQPNYPTGAPSVPLFQEGEELSTEQANQRLVQAADAIAQARIEQRMSAYEAQQQTRAYIDSVEADVTHLERTYDELNPDSPKYNQVLAESITEMFELASDGGQRKSVQLRSIAERQVALARAAAEAAQANTQATLATQAASAAIPPTPAPQRAFDPRTAPLEELEKRLGYA